MAALSRVRRFEGKGRARGLGRIPVVQTLLGDQDVRELNARFESAEPREILRWALEDSGIERIAVASAFQAEGTAIIHMAIQHRPDIPVLFLETGFHFAETLAFKQRLTEAFGLNVVDLTGDYTVDEQAEKFGPRLYERDPKLCCELNKVIPFNRALGIWTAGLPGCDATPRGRGPTRRSCRGPSSTQGAGCSR